MINLKSTLTTITVAALSLLLPPLVSSCSMMHDDLDGCKQELRVRFKYDMNMKFADAFSGQVKAVTLHVYDQSGRLVFKKTQSVDDIDAAGGYMTLDNIKSGNYTMQVWAEGEQRRLIQLLHQRRHQRQYQQSRLQDKPQLSPNHTRPHPTLSRTSVQCRPQHRRLWCKDRHRATH